MDPNATLERLRELAANGDATYAGTANEMAELVEALDGWLVKGGFLPARWMEGRARLAGTPLTQIDYGMNTEDCARAEEIARALGYEQTAYTSTSALIGLYCLNENPATWRGNPRALHGGCVVKTVELGWVFVQHEDDLHLILNERR